MKQSSLMAMPRREDFSQIPRAVAQLLEQSSSGLRASLRSARFGEGPVTVLSRAEQLPAAWMAVYAFETLMGRAAMVRTPATFEHYSVQAVAPRSTIFVLPGAAHSPDGLRALKKARDVGATIWAHADAEDEDLAKVAHGILPLPEERVGRGEVLPVLLEHVAIASFALHAAKLLRPPSHLLQECERELDELPEKINWLFSNLQDAAAALAEELRKRQHLLVSGGGAYHAAALRAALDLRARFGTDCRAVDASELASAGDSKEVQGRAILLLSGSHCRLKKQVQQEAARAKIEGREVFSVTDRDDRELAARSVHSILIAPHSELVGGLLTMTLAMWISALPPRKDGPTSESHPPR